MKMSDLNTLTMAALVRWSATILTDSRELVEPGIPGARPRGAIGPERVMGESSSPLRIVSTSVAIAFLNGMSFISTSGFLMSISSMIASNRRML